MGKTSRRTADKRALKMRTGKIYPRLAPGHYRGKGYSWEKGEQGKLAAEPEGTP